MTSPSVKQRHLVDCHPKLSGRKQLTKMTKMPPASWSDLELAAPPAVEARGVSDSSERDTWTPSGPLALSCSRQQGAVADLPGTRDPPRVLSQTALQPGDTGRAGTAFPFRW